METPSCCSAAIQGARCLALHAVLVVCCYPFLLVGLQIPSAHGRIPVANGGRQKVRKTSGEIVLDVDAIVSDFQLLGEGLVKTVQILN